MSHDGYGQAEGGALRFVDPPRDATVCSECFWSAPPYGMFMITSRSLARSRSPIPYGFPVRPATWDVIAYRVPCSSFSLFPFVVTLYGLFPAGISHP
jgi:hypothetical protein